MKLGKDVILKATKFLNFIKTKAVTLEGKTLEWVWAQRPNGQNAVVIIPVVWHDGEFKLVLIREFRVPLKDYEWGFPAGLIDEGEDGFDTAKRELKEESGMKVVSLLWRSPPIYSSAGMTDEAVEMICVEVEGELSRTGLDDSEEIEPAIVGRDGIRWLMQDPTNKFGAKAYLTLLWFVNDPDFLERNPMAPVNSEELNQLYQE